MPLDEDYSQAMMRRESNAKSFFNKKIKGMDSESNVHASSESQALITAENDNK